MNYLALVNKVIQESGSEIDELTSVTWSTAVAGRRQYPRIKRYVADAWKMIQMKRDEWEFKATEYTTTVNPRVKFMEGDAAIAPVVGAVFVGDDSGFTFTVSSILLDNGAWADGDAEGQFEFTVHSGAQAPILGETFTSGSNTFVYSGRGAYDFTLSATDLFEIQWPTMVVSTGNNIPIPAVFVPWNNWEETAFSYADGGQVAPVFVSQDPLGRVVFYAQTLDSFRIFFVYNATPQELSAYTDTPTDLPAHYHEWIAWEALKKLALYDKNMALYNHAEDTAKLFSRSAEKNLMPKISWAESPYNE
jgi:hypothetical protein